MLNGGISLLISLNEGKRSLKLVRVNTRPNNTRNVKRGGRQGISCMLFGEICIRNARCKAVIGDRKSTNEYNVSSIEISKCRTSETRSEMRRAISRVFDIFLYCRFSKILSRARARAFRISLRIKLAVQRLRNTATCLLDDRS